MILTYSHQSAMNDADDTMSLFTSILKDIAEQTIPKTSAVPKRFNKTWFSDTCKDTSKERNRALERFKREPTEDNLNAYPIARANKICLGAFRTSHVESLYIDAHEHCLGVGRAKLSLQYAAKTKSLPKYPTYDTVFDDRYMKLLMRGRLPSVRLDFALSSF